MILANKDSWPKWQCALQKKLFLPVCRVKKEKERKNTPQLAGKEKLFIDESLLCIPANEAVSYNFQWLPLVRFLPLRRWITHAYVVNAKIGVKMKIEAFFPPLFFSLWFPSTNLWLTDAQISWTNILHLVAQWSSLSFCATHLENALNKPDQRPKHSNKKKKNRQITIFSSHHTPILRVQQFTMPSLLSRRKICVFLCFSYRRPVAPPQGPPPSAGAGCTLGLSPHLISPGTHLSPPSPFMLATGSWRSCSSRTRPASALATNLHANTYFPCIPGQAEAACCSGNSQVGRRGEVTKHKNFNSTSEKDFRYFFAFTLDICTQMHTNCLESFRCRNMHKDLQVIPVTVELKIKTKRSYWRKKRNNITPIRIHCQCGRNRVLVDLPTRHLPWLYCWTGTFSVLHAITLNSLLQCD